MHKRINDEKNLTKEAINRLLTELNKKVTSNEFKNEINKTDILQKQLNKVNKDWCYAIEKIIRKTCDTSEDYDTKFKIVT